MEWRIYEWLPRSAPSKNTTFERPQSTRPVNKLLELLETRLNGRIVYRADALSDFRGISQVDSLDSNENNFRSSAHHEYPSRCGGEKTRSCEARAIGNLPRWGGGEFHGPKRAFAASDWYFYRREIATLATSRARVSAIIPRGEFENPRGGLKTNSSQTGIARDVCSAILFLAPREICECHRASTRTRI